MKSKRKKSRKVQEEKARKASRIEARKAARTVLPAKDYFTRLCPAKPPVVMELGFDEFVIDDKINPRTTEHSPGMDGTIKSVGVLNDPLANKDKTGTIKLFAGFGRVKNAKKAGKSKVKLKVYERLTPIQMRHLQGIEQNPGRSDWAPTDTMGLIHEIISDAIKNGVSEDDAIRGYSKVSPLAKDTIRNFWMLSQQPAAIREAVRRGWISSVGSASLFWERTIGDEATKFILDRAQETFEKRSRGLTAKDLLSAMNDYYEYESRQDGNAADDDEDEKGSRKGKAGKKQGAAKGAKAPPKMDRPDEDAKDDEDEDEDDEEDLDEALDLESMKAPIPPKKSDVQDHVMVLARALSRAVVASPFDETQAVTVASSDTKERYSFGGAVDVVCALLWTQTGVPPVRGFETPSEARLRVVYVLQNVGKHVVMSLLYNETDPKTWKAKYQIESDVDAAMAQIAKAAKGKTVPWDLVFAWVQDYIKSKSYASGAKGAKAGAVEPVATADDESISKDKIMQMDETELRELLDSWGIAYNKKAKKKTLLTVACAALDQRNDDDGDED